MSFLSIIMFRLIIITGILASVTVLRSSCDAINKNVDGSAKILQYDFLRNDIGKYHYSFETTNGIKRNETGDEADSIHDDNQKAALIKGYFSYTGADGKIYEVKYVADEAGFHPEGEHLQIPPFTPWIPGQPIDDGQYKEDNSGEYRPDSTGNYKPDFISGEQILNTFLSSPSPIIDNNALTQKYLPSTTPKYISGESILDTFLNPQKNVKKPSPPSFTSTEKVLDIFRDSYRPTPQYLPSSPAPRKYQNSENPLDNEIIKKAFFNKPTPHPDIILRSTPVNPPKLPEGFPKPFGDATQNRPNYVKFIQKKKN